MTDMHTCHDGCDKPLCVAQRRIAELEATRAQPNTDAVEAFLEAASNEVKAVRAETDPLLPDEPYMSMQKAAEIHATLTTAQPNADLLREVRDLLGECGAREYNPFEPDNQSAHHGKIASMIARLQAQGAE